MNTTTATLPATEPSAPAKTKIDLPFRIPPQEWFTLRQAGEALGLAESTVEKLYGRGELTGHSHNAGAGLRKHKRVLRASLIAYAIRTGNYTDASLADALSGCLRNLPAATLLRIASEAQRLAQDKPITRSA